MALKSAHNLTTEELVRKLENVTRRVMAITPPKTRAEELERDMQLHLVDQIETELETRGVK